MSLQLRNLVRCGRAATCYVTSRSGLCHWPIVHDYWPVLDTCRYSVFQQRTTQHHSCHLCAGYGVGVRHNTIHVIHVQATESEYDTTPFMSFMCRLRSRRMTQHHSCHSCAGYGVGVRHNTIHVQATESEYDTTPFMCKLRSRSTTQHHSCAGYGVGVAQKRTLSGNAQCGLCKSCTEQANATAHNGTTVHC